MPFKVVEKKTRWGSNWALFKDLLMDCEISPEKCYKGLKFRREHPEFFPHYYKGHTVKAVPGTAGIMCFPTRADAERFRDDCRYRGRFIIIEVKGIGSPRKVDQVIEWCGSRPWNLLDPNPKLQPALYATIAFDAVKVLE